MHDFMQWSYGFIIGAAAALLYFGGLWITVRRLPRARNPWRQYATSLVVRLGVLGLALFYGLQSDWLPVVAAAMAFLLVRYFLVFVLAGPSSPVSHE
jgi:F1F0 ATPase subunit 2